VSCIAKGTVHAIIADVNFCKVHRGTQKLKNDLPQNLCHYQDDHYKKKKKKIDLSLKFNDSHVPAL
jgi:hypothetical protein